MECGAKISTKQTRPSSSISFGEASWILYSTAYQLHKECVSSRYLNSNNDSVLTFFSSSICTLLWDRRRIFVLQRSCSECTGRVSHSCICCVIILARDSRFRYFLQTRANCSRSGALFSLGTKEAWQLRKVRLFNHVRRATIHTIHV